MSELQAYQKCKYIVKQKATTTDLARQDQIQDSYQPCIRNIKNTHISPYTEVCNLTNNNNYVPLVK